MGKHIDKKTSEVKVELIEMMKDVKGLYQSIILCTEDFDDSCLKSVIKKDKDINQQELQLNESIVEYMIKFSPIATDLRESISYLKIANELERIADYTTNIAKIFRRGIAFTDYEIKKITYGLNLIIEFLDSTQDVITNYSTTLAYELVENDKELDDLYNNYYSKQIINLDADRNIEVVISTVTILKYLERAGDHIVNIIEHMIYAQKAKYVNL